MSIWCWSKFLRCLKKKEQIRRLSEDEKWEEEINTYCFDLNLSMIIWNVLNITVWLPMILQRDWVAPVSFERSYKLTSKLPVKTDRNQTHFFSSLGSTSKSNSFFTKRLKSLIRLSIMLDSSCHFVPKWIANLSNSLLRETDSENELSIRKVQRNFFKTTWISSFLNELDLMCE